MNAPHTSNKPTRPVMGSRYDVPYVHDILDALEEEMRVPKVQFTDEEIRALLSAISELANAEPDAEVSLALDSAEQKLRAAK